MQLEADEIIAFRHFITLKQICDWLQGGIAAGSFCRRILMMQFLRWTSSTSLTPPMFQTLWVISKLIIYESFWRKLLGLSQESFFPLLYSSVLSYVFCLSHLILIVNKYIKLEGYVSILQQCIITFITLIKFSPWKHLCKWIVLRQSC